MQADTNPSPQANTEQEQSDSAQNPAQSPRIERPPASPSFAKQLEMVNHALTYPGVGQGWFFFLGCFGLLVMALTMSVYDGVREFRCPAPAQSQIEANY